MYDALISIKPFYVEKIINGNKVVEIRNRKVQILSGSRLWIYSTLPKASIQIFAYVQKVDIESPSLIWRKYKKFIGISKDIFDTYVNGSEFISAIVVENIIKLPIEITLNKIRKEVPGFQPPQFLKYMKKDDPVLSAITDQLQKRI